MEVVSKRELNLQQYLLRRQSLNIQALKRTQIAHTEKTRNPENTHRPTRKTAYFYKPSKRYIFTIVSYNTFPQQCAASAYTPFILWTNIGAGSLPMMALWSVFDSSSGQDNHEEFLAQPKVIS